MISICIEDIKSFLYKNGKIILIGIVIFLQTITIVKLHTIETLNNKMNHKIADIQAILWLSHAPDTGLVAIKNGLVNPVEKQKVLLPIKPDNQRDVAVIEKWYQDNDNYYPLNTPITYYVSDNINIAGMSYSKKLINMWWQILNIKKSNTANADHIVSFVANNGNSIFEAQFSTELSSYKKAIQWWSFVTIVLKK